MMVSQLILDMETQMDRIKPPFCAVCRRVVDRFERISISAKTRMFEFKVYCHGAVEPLQVSYDSMILIPFMASIQPRAFSGAEPTNREIEFKKSVERSIPKKEIEEQKSVKRLLNLEGIK